MRAWFIGEMSRRGLVIIDAVNGLERDIRYGEYSEEGEYTEIVETVDVHCLVEIPPPVIHSLPK